MRYIDHPIPWTLNSPIVWFFFKVVSVRPSEAEFGYPPMILIKHSHGDGFHGELLNNQMVYVKFIRFKKKQLV
jgi:hypothetical protein